MNFPDIKKIIIHCSDSAFGDKDLIESWHLRRGFKSIGYHFVITNGVLAHGNAYNPINDGLVQLGRSLTEQGAHCQHHNADSIGICLIGCRHFTAAQLLHTLPDLLASFMALPNITGPECVFGHRDFNPAKTCPNIDTALLRFLAAAAQSAGRPTSSPERTYL
jgi:N-acetyl-anhydromuramyl-L-alanine amidase AmpD